MGQRARILAQVLGFDGWRVTEAFFESGSGARVLPLGGFAVLRETRLVLVVERRWLPRCPECAGPCRGIISLESRLDCQNFGLTLRMMTSTTTPREWTLNLGRV